MKASITLSLMIVLLDAIGLGLIMPILPTLLTEFTSNNQTATHYGVLLALYALMQVIFAPILGKVSDYFGRKPVLLLSLLGASLDYTLLAFSSSLWMLYLGRMLSGITGATGAVAASIVADNTPEKERTKWFGKLGAAFGVGLIIGPVIGGIAGQYATHLPFMIAAVLNAMACVLVYCFFHEKPAQKPKQTHSTAQTTTHSVSFLTIIKPVLVLLMVYFSAQLIGQIPATTWVLFTEYRFQWNSFHVGLSLAGLGLMHAIFQAFVAGRITQRWGEKNTILIGFIADALAFFSLSMIMQAWLIYPTLILLAGGGIALPALQSIISQAVYSDHQGKLQGLLVSIANASGIIGPPIFAWIYGKTQNTWDGSIWIIGVVMYCLILGFFIQANRAKKTKPISAP